MKGGGGVVGVLGVWVGAAGQRGSKGAGEMLSVPHMQEAGTLTLTPKSNHEWQNRLRVTR